MSVSELSVYVHVCGYGCTCMCISGYVYLKASMDVSVCICVFVCVSLCVSCYLGLGGLEAWNGPGWLPRRARPQAGDL